ncbi:MAG: ice-binding family protein [Nitrososphaerales archaeon]
MKTYKIGLVLVIALLTMAAGVPYAHAQPAPVNLGTAGNYVILAETTITTTGTSTITGNIGISPNGASSITGFAMSEDPSNQFWTSAQVTGEIYAADNAVPTPATLTTAVLDMQNAYSDAAGRSCPAANTGLGGGTLNGQTLATGVYCWTTNLDITGGITLSGSSSGVWIFQVPGTLTVASTIGAVITLSGGATYNNVFWVVGGQTTIGTADTFQGIILDYTSIALQTGTTLTGRALAQAAVTLEANAITASTTSTTTSTTSTSSSTTSVSSSTTSVSSSTTSVSSSTTSVSSSTTSTSTTSTPPTVPEFPLSLSVALVTAISLLGLALLRGKYLPRQR